MKVWFFGITTLLFNIGRYIFIFWLSCFLSHEELFYTRCLLSYMSKVGRKKRADI